MPRVSVVLNCFDQEEYVAEAVESVLQQTFADLELIAIDNGSGDRTPSVLQQYGTDPRVHLFLHDDNASITRRFNEGVRAATGDLVCFLYSDDYYLRHKLAVQVGAFDRAGPEVGVVYGPGSGRNELTGDRWVQPWIAVGHRPLQPLLDHWLDGQIDMITPMFRRECLTAHPFHEDIFAEGEAILFRIALTHDFLFLDEPLAVSRDTGRNAGKAIRRNRDITFQALDRLADDPRFPDDARASLDAFRRRLDLSYAWQAARLGEDVAWARERLRDAGRGRPLAVIRPRAAGALALSILPPSLRRAVNRIGFRLRRGEGNDILVEDFPGAIF